MSKYLYWCTRVDNGEDYHYTSRHEHNIGDKIHTPVGDVIIYDMAEEPLESSRLSTAFHRRGL